RFELDPPRDRGQERVEGAYRLVGEAALSPGRPRHVADLAVREAEALRVIISSALRFEIARNREGQFVGVETDADRRRASGQQRDRALAVQGIAHHVVMAIASLHAGAFVPLHVPPKYLGMHREQAVAAAPERQPAIAYPLDELAHQRDAAVVDVRRVDKP